MLTAAIMGAAVVTDAVGGTGEYRPLATLSAAAAWFCGLTISQLWSVARFVVADLGLEDAAKWVVGAVKAAVADDLMAAAEAEMAAARGLPTSGDQLH